MRFLGSGAISYLQDSFGAGVYFNPYVEVNGMVLISICTFDLDHQIWRRQFGYVVSGFTGMGYYVFGWEAT